METAQVLRLARSNTCTVCCDLRLETVEMTIRERSAYDRVDSTLGELRKSAESDCKGCHLLRSVVQEDKLVDELEEKGKDLAASHGPLDHEDTAFDLTLFEGFYNDFPNLMIKLAGFGSPPPSWVESSITNVYCLPGKYRSVLCYVMLWC